MLTIEDEARPSDVWVLRRPVAGEQVPSRVLLGRGPAEEAAEMWEAFAGGDAVGEGARAVPVVELLDDDVDLSPEHHLQRRASAEAGRQVAELLATAPADLPALRLVDDVRNRPSATVAELARRGVLTVRHAPRDAATPEAGDGGAAVLTVSDLATGTVPTGRAAGAAPGRIRVRPGDVVAAPMGRARVADRPAVLGPALTVYRTDPTSSIPSSWPASCARRPRPAARRAGTATACASRCSRSRSSGRWGRRSAPCSTPPTPREPLPSAPTPSCDWAAKGWPRAGCVPVRDRTRLGRS